ncbi:hypothetical protein [Kitasatospora sp. NPDC058218]|uniref:hypothetical protein n=1 Tax=Kitasatospora sp. NPDC058218 TaxID=3346385 RepID=UPI0036D992D2
MTNSLSSLPVSAPRPTDDYPDDLGADDERAEQAAARAAAAREEHELAVREALALAADAGEAAAAWVRELAARQDDERHALVLGNAAEAIVHASAREVIPGGEGRLVEELRYRLAADVLLGATHTGTLPELRTGERLALVAVCALAAAMPGCVLGDLERELTLLADELNATTAIGRAAATETLA